MLKMKLLVAFYIVLLTIGCTRDTKLIEKEEAFSKMFPIKDMNSIITFLDPKKDSRNFYIGESISLILENHRKNDIAASYKDSVIILRFDEVTNQWIEIPNGAKCKHKSCD
jgi:hypothetical protein